MTKIQKFLNFQRFYAIFVIFSIDIVDENVENVQQGTNSLSNNFLRRDKCGFSKVKLPQKQKKITIFFGF